MQHGFTQTISGGSSCLIPIQIILQICWVFFFFFFLNGTSKYQKKMSSSVFILLFPLNDSPTQEVVCSVSNAKTTVDK